MIARFDGAFSGRGLLDHVGDLDDAVLDRLARDDAVLARLGVGNLLQGDDRISAPLVEPHHLPDARHVRVDDVVAEHHRERLAPHEVLRLQHRVAEAERLLLAHVRDGDHLRDLADLGEEVLLAALLQHRLELEGRVEVILDRVLPAAGDDHDPLDPGVPRLLDDVLDQGPVDERQHLLGLGLGGRQEPGSQAGGGEDGDANGGHSASLADRAAASGAPSVLSGTSLSTIRRAEQRPRETAGPKGVWRVTRPAADIETTVTEH